MHRPVLVTAPAILPISLVEAKAHLHVDNTADDTLITALIRAAVGHLDGWTGILGRCLEEQTWQQDFDSFRPCLHLPLAPVISITGVTVGGDAVDTSAYALKVDAGGRSLVEFEGVSGSGAVTITYKAGYATIPEVPAVEAGAGDPPVPPASDAIPAQSTVPAELKTAILLMVQHFYSLREAGNMYLRAETVEGVGRQEFTITENIGKVVDRAVDSLIAPYRRIGV